jgi:hypothetical protein
MAKRPYTLACFIKDNWEDQNLKEAPFLPGLYESNGMGKIVAFTKSRLIKCPLLLDHVILENFGARIVQSW